MRVDHLPCGAFVNASEETAFTYLRDHLSGELGDERFLLLTNVAHSVAASAPADEIDMVVLGSTGVQVIEVKHWDRNYMRRNRWCVEEEADKLERKTRRVATRLRAEFPKLGRVDGKMLLTRQKGSLCRGTAVERVRGIGLYALEDWRRLLDLDRPNSIPEDRLDALAKVIVPRADIALRGELRRLGNIVELNRLTPTGERLHRVYRGRHAITQDRVVLHLYDLSATNAANALNVARREFEVLSRLQKSPWLPRLIDSLQDLPNYPGELLFFTVADSDAPSLADRAADSTWTIDGRLVFAVNALRALNELHEPPDDMDAGVIHRTITPDVIRVRPGNRPLFTNWQLAKRPGHPTVSGAPENVDTRWAAPEVRAGGLAAADRRSDVYALCACLCRLFKDMDDERADLARMVLEQGLENDPEARPSLTTLVDELQDVAGEAKSAAPPEPRLPPASQWAEDTELEVDGHRYRIIGRLGSGGIGRTFKVVQLALDGSEEIGTFVAKTVSAPDLGEAALLAHMRVRPHTSHPSLARIYSTATEWSDNAVLALLDWVEGAPLGDFAGVIEIYAEDLGETSAEELVLSWLRDLCGALGTLHRVGLVHGDVSPSNILVNGTGVTLIDYDMVTRRGEVVPSEGTRPFSAPAVRTHQPVSFADDVFALAATIYHIVTDREPFMHDGVWAHENGLVWTDEARAGFPRVVRFCDLATGTSDGGPFADGFAAAAFIDELLAGGSGAPPAPPSPTETLRENEVPWLKDILSVYPGSRYGNSETRGLDSEFAEQTYVETGLDSVLRDEIQQGAVSLVILCGNAGDGKTALLQHLAETLGVDRRPSAERMWEAELPDGIRVKTNLDGAAAWRGRSADELLDEIFAPFHWGRPAQRIVHIVAVNNGRLLEWVEGYEARHHGPTDLTEQIVAALEGDADALAPHVRLIELNLRSLVGGLSDDGTGISAEWLIRLVSRLVGGDRAREIWRPCLTCVAQDRCTAWNSAAMLGARADPEARRRGELLLERLTEALQAVHQRGEVHITARELKATLSYVLFGVDWCKDIHAQPDAKPWATADLAFDADSPLRQGELLAELARLDPALEAHARIDRYLASRLDSDPEHGAPRYPEVSLKSARRRAYFEWTSEQIEAVGGTPNALGLARGRHFRRFRRVPLMDEAERAQLLSDVCGGISRLEDLPPVALSRSGVVPVRVLPRTPTETAFWVEKPLDRFALEPERLNTPPGLEALHRSLVLKYAMDGAGGGRSETLSIPLELFALLLEINEGVQLLDASSDDVFANLAIFVQRLAQEDERHLMAWNLSAGDTVFELSARMANAGQVIDLRPVN